MDHITFVNIYEKKIRISKICRQVDRNSNKFDFEDISVCDSGVCSDNHSPDLA